MINNTNMSSPLHSIINSIVVVFVFGGWPQCGVEYEYDNDPDSPNLFYLVNTIRYIKPNLHNIKPHCYFRMHLRQHTEDLWTYFYTTTFPHIQNKKYNFYQESSPHPLFRANIKTTFSWKHQCELIMIYHHIRGIWLSPVHHFTLKQIFLF